MQLPSVRNKISAVIKTVGSGQKLKKRKKTYNRMDSLVVTDPTTNIPVCGLSMAEQTGSPVFRILWSYVIGEDVKWNICHKFGVFRTPKKIEWWCTLSAATKASGLWMWSRARSMSNLHILGPIQTLPCDNEPWKIFSRIFSAPWISKHFPCNSRMADLGSRSSNRSTEVAMPKSRTRGTRFDQDLLIISRTYNW